CARSPFDFW
nr:immunoglobulin heavy chain junction region [Mus musculus]